MPVVYWKIHLGFIVILCEQSSINCERLKNGTEIIPHGVSILQRCYVFATETYSCASSSSSSSQNTELEYRLPFSLSSGLPYWSINRQVVRLKSSPICSQGPNWSWRSGEVYFSIGLLPLWIQQQWWTCPCTCVVLLSCFLLPFSISKPVIFIFHDILHNKFKCLLSSSNQTVGDILEKKWNKMLCD